MMRILICYDGSESSDGALLDLRHAGLPSEAEALIVSVADVFMLPSSSSYEVVESALTSHRLTSSLMLAQARTERVLSEAKEFASQATDRVRTLFPGWEVRAETLAGNPAEELIKKAAAWKADLVVAGSHGRSAAGRLILGSVSKRIVTDSSSSVRVVRHAAGKSNDISPRVIIGIDGSSGAERAVRMVGRRLWPGGTEVRIVAVDNGASPRRIAQIFPTAAAIVRDCNEEGAVATRMMVEWAEAELSAIGLRTSVRFERGDPSQVLMREAREWEADSIFVGSREFSGAFERFRLGSVSTALVSKAPCSVEVVRANPGATDGWEQADGE